MIPLLLFMYPTFCIASILSCHAIPSTGSNITRFAFIPYLDTLLITLFSPRQVNWDSLPATVELTVPAPHKIDPRSIIAAPLTTTQVLSLSGLRLLLSWESIGVIYDSITVTFKVNGIGVRGDWNFTGMTYAINIGDVLNESGVVRCDGEGSFSTGLGQFTTGLGQASAGEAVSEQFDRLSSLLSVAETATRVSSVYTKVSGGGNDRRQVAFEVLLLGLLCLV